MSGHVHPDELNELETHQARLCNQKWCRYCREDDEQLLLRVGVQDLVKALEVTLREIDSWGVGRRPPWFEEYEQLAYKHKAVKDVRRTV